MRKKLLFINQGAWRKCFSMLCILCCSSLMAFGQKVIKGHVIDATGEAVIGANVVEKGTTNGISTDADGRFTLTVGNNAVIRVSFIGYVPQEVTVGNQTNLNIVLQEDS
ncbi:MAG: carboxypeptidase-like regulatory domain-containing protein, partial [Tannerella sp.]|nr:carboxypeptidase-like regulatory domain-containing protein [Tannerella sp.]